MGNDISWAIHKTFSDYASGARHLMQCFAESQQAMTDESVLICHGKNPACLMVVSPIVVIGGGVTKGAQAGWRAYREGKKFQAALHWAGVAATFIAPGATEAAVGPTTSAMARVTTSGAVFAGATSGGEILTAAGIASVGMMMSSTERQLTDQFGEQVTVVAKGEDLPMGIYKYMVVEMEDGTRQLRIGRGLPTNEHHDLALPGEKVVGAGRLQYTQEGEIIIDGSSGGYQTGRKVSSLMLRGVTPHPTAKEAGISAVADHLKTLFPDPTTMKITITP